jgi:GNAT superfamily N-acetyltransferase
MVEREKVKDIFKNWNDGLVSSYLQGYMGCAEVDDEMSPKSCRITVGDFAFFAGVPDQRLIETSACPIITVENEAWDECVERALGDRVTKSTRYKMKELSGGFDLKTLSFFIRSLDNNFTIKKIDEKIYEEILSNSWSMDMCSQFKSYDDFHDRGIGFVVYEDAKLVSGASSYVVYDDSIEIEIDTLKEYRNRGLAASCGAKLILECVRRDIYPGWDAMDLRSASLAKKLGYQIDSPYSVYSVKQ